MLVITARSHEERLALMDSLDDLGLAVSTARGDDFLVDAHPALLIALAGDYAERCAERSVLPLVRRSSGRVDG